MELDDRNLERILPEGYSRSDGLPRVCCVGRPEDLATHREEVAADLLGVRPCAVCFPDPADFSDVQVAVFLITKSFLEDPACLSAFSTAAEKNVPILPLQLEPGVAEGFNAFCLGRFKRTYQLLWKGDPDPTAIPYETKLERFLDRVFLEEGPVRQHLDAVFRPGSIFLSYRKKNRVLAQELMKRIHDLPGRENIRIWYDEFLEPGEAWDKTLQSKVRNSTVMFLAATPDVLEEGNYVRNEECPTALEKPVPIVPVVMDAMTPDQLAELKDDILADRTHDARGWMRNDWKLDAALDSKLDTYFKGRRTYQPEELFCLGMAYLHGYQVELCRERGVAMLEEAADSSHNYADGFLPAIRALADLYATGNGVAIDFNRSIELREVIVARLRGIPGREQEYQNELMCLVQDCDSAGGEYLERAEQYAREAVDIAADLPAGVPAVLRLGFELPRQFLVRILLKKSTPDFEGAEAQLERLEALAREVIEKAEDADGEGIAAQVLYNTLKQRKSLCLRWSDEVKDEKPALGKEYARCLGQIAQLAETFPGVVDDTDRAEWHSILDQAGEAAKDAEKALKRARQEFDAARADPWQQQICRKGLVGAYVNAILFLLETGEVDRAREYIVQAREWNQPLLDAGETQAVEYEKSLAKFQARVDAAQV